jgi:hypothetical protein
LFKLADILYRNLSSGNILLDENEQNGLWHNFDLEIVVNQSVFSGAPGKTGTKVFMAISALLGESHSSMHDLKSFSWMLF